MCLGVKITTIYVTFSSQIVHRVLGIAPRRYGIGRNVIRFSAVAAALVIGFCGKFVGLQKRVDVLIRIRQGEARSADEGVQKGSMDRLVQVVGDFVTFELRKDSAFLQQKVDKVFGSGLNGRLEIDRLKGSVSKTIF